MVSSGRLALLAATIGVVGAVTASAAQLGGDPGTAFEMPKTGDYYWWSIDLTDVSDGDILLDFDVTVPAGGAFLRTFQIFALDAGDTCVDGRFDLQVNQPGDTGWTDTFTLEPCSYHNYEEVTLSAGVRSFVVTASSLTFDSDWADVRFGDVIAAIPVPAPAVLLTGGLVALAGLRRFGAARKSDRS